VLRTALITSAALIAFTALPNVASAQYGPAPWCAVVSVGNGDVYWDCEYATAAECAPNVIAGNRGFCNRNPYFDGRVAEEGHGCRVIRRHVHRHGRRVVITRRICR
jgi:hypothetical protein